MKHIIQLLIALLLVLISSPLPAQRWREMWAQPDQFSLLEVKAAFDAHYATHKRVKGDGYMQFQRFWYYAETRLNAQGRLGDTRTPAWQARLAAEQAQPASQARTTTTNGNWYDIHADIGKEDNGNVVGIGRVTVVAFHPTNPNILYVGTPVSGVWRSTNHGTSWEPLTSDEPFWGVCALTVDPNNGNTLWAITGDDFGATPCTGVYKSTNGGTDWAEQNSFPLTLTGGNGYSSRKILVNPSNSQIVYAAIAGFNAGLFKTTNGGTTWTQIVMNNNIQDFELHPTNPSILYVCDVNSIWRSTNAGGSFGSPVFTAPYANGNDGMRLAVTPASPNTVYALCGNKNLPAGSYGGLFKSINSGAAWSSALSTTPNILSVASGNGQGGPIWWSLGLAVSPANANIVHAGSLQEWSSTNGGVNWTANAYLDAQFNQPGDDDCHSDLHYLAYNDGKLYYCNDGGIYYTTNGGSRWWDISAGLHITDVYKTSSCEADPCMLVAGTQEVGSNVMHGPFRDPVMDMPWGGDGMDNAIVPNDPSKVYVCGFAGNSLGFSSQGAIQNSIVDITPTTLGPGDWVTPIQINPSKYSTLLVAYTEVGVRYSYGQGSWVNLSPGAFGNDFTPAKAVTFAPSDTTTIYVAKGPRVYRTTNYGSTWANISTGLSANGAVKGIAVDPLDARHAFVVCSNWSAGEKVYELLNGSTQWINLSGSLPNVPAECIVYQKDTRDGLYVGTDAGVYYRDDFSGGWQPFSNGLPYVGVNDLDILYETKKLRAATTGRGVWETHLQGVTIGNLLSLSGTTSATIVNEAYGQITSSQTINSPGNVTYRSASAVKLNPSFRVNPGATFLGTVSPCMDVLPSQVPTLKTAEVDMEAEPIPLEKVPEAFSITLYPHPADAYVTLRLDMPEAKHSHIAVYDLAMRRIGVVDDQMRDAGSYAIQLQTDKWPAGTYLLQVKQGDHAEVRKLVIQH